MQKKLVMLFIAILLAFVILVGRITYINASSGEDYTKTVLDQQQYMSRSIPFKRGDIVDTNGTKLATSERVYNVILDAKVLLSDETKKAENSSYEKSAEKLFSDQGIGSGCNYRGQSGQSVQYSEKRNFLR